MKRLSAIRLVNWYHFSDQLFRLAGSCLLLGDNGSGKSTVLDAIQYALVADAGEVRFNQAANEGSKRNLYGYVRYKLGTEDTARPGQIQFGRGACTSYLLLEFLDDEDPTASFTCGAVLEARESDATVDHWHLVLPRTRLEEVPAVEDDVVRPSRDFRRIARERGWKVLPAGEYRDELRHRLGPLPQTFHRLLVRAAAFRPIGRVRQFVFDYLLDERPVNTESLQANLENYKRLEAEARRGAERMRDLERVCELGERIGQERRIQESHRFMFLRADAEAADTALRELGERLEVIATEREALRGQQRVLTDRREFVDRERQRVGSLLAGSSVHLQISALERDLSRLRADVRAAENADHEARAALALQGQLLASLTTDPARAVREALPAIFADDELTGLSDQDPKTARLAELVQTEGALHGRDLHAWLRRLETTSATLSNAELLQQHRAEELKTEGKALQEERAELERGRNRYPDGVEALLHLLRTKLKGSREPVPLCEVIDVQSDRWRDAVEGYLNTRRFDVLVAPEDFPRALALYERNKREYVLPGRGKIFIANAGLVDAERILASQPRAELRSLASQVETDDPIARAYCDFVMGDVVCVDSEQDLRRHRRAITDTVMVYQGHVARQTAREVYARHYIGQAARLRRKDEIDRRLAELAAELIALSGRLDFLKDVRKRCARALAEASRLPLLIEQAAVLPNLRRELASVQRQLEGLDRSEIALLEKEKAELERLWIEVGADLTRVERHDAVLGQEAARLEHDRPEVQARNERAERVLAEALAQWEPDERPSLETRYLEEREKRSSREIHEIFERQHRGMETRVANLVLDLVQLKEKFAQTHGFVGDPGASRESVEAHRAELALWRESRLPEYEEKIGRAKAQAIQQLAEDVIFKLRENLISVDRHFEELNRSLREVRFGADRYSFSREVAPEHKAFYDLIMDAGRFEKDSLFGNQALAGETVRKTLEDLWEQLVRNEARQVKTELEAKADYREYFLYDLKIHHDDGSVELFDRVSGDKSGGETQTPFYIAILASFSRLYRHGSTTRRPGCGLVLLDEAFSKMDEARIKALLGLSRSLELQLILATPKERSELVSPSIETSLYIHKDPLSGAPLVLEFGKELFAHGDAADGATGVADAPAREA